jgi:hypothetical protein
LPIRQSFEIAANEANQGDVDSNLYTGTPNGFGRRIIAVPLAAALSLSLAACSPNFSGGSESTEPTTAVEIEPQNTSLAYFQKLGWESTLSYDQTDITAENIKDKKFFYQDPNLSERTCDISVETFDQDYTNGLKVKDYNLTISSSAFSQKGEDENGGEIWTSVPAQSVQLFMRREGAAANPAENFSSILQAIADGSTPLEVAETINGGPILSPEFVEFLQVNGINIAVRPFSGNNVKDRSNDAFFLQLGKNGKKLAISSSGSEVSWDYAEAYDRRIAELRAERNDAQSAFDTLFSGEDVPEDIVAALADARKRVADAQAALDTALPAVGAVPEELVYKYHYNGDPPIYNGLVSSGRFANGDDYNNSHLYTGYNINVDANLFPVFEGFFSVTYDEDLEAVQADIDAANAAEEAARIAQWQEGGEYYDQYNGGL